MKTLVYNFRKMAAVIDNEELLPCDGDEDNDDTDEEEPKLLEFRSSGTAVEVKNSTLVIFSEVLLIFKRRARKLVHQRVIVEAY